jgi:1-acyl-sn-glycerol-3-phosphate acyltransferase
MGLLTNIVKNTLVTSEMQAQSDKLEMPNLSDAGWDPWGFNKDVALAGMPGIKFLHDQYFRVQSHGIEKVPKKGRVLLIANHAGQLPMDGVMISAAMALREKDPRVIRVMIERFFPTVPFLGNYLNACGAVVGDPVNCTTMLENDEAVLVFPEGIRGSGKLWKDRYTLKRMGNGFVRLAVMTGTPIIPIGVVGSEETMPAVHNFAGLAKMLGVPYVPLAPLIPLPAKLNIYFGDPIQFGGDPDDVPLMYEHVDRVRAEINQLLQKGLKARKRIF